MGGGEFIEVVADDSDVAVSGAVEATEQGQPHVSVLVHVPSVGICRYLQSKEALQQLSMMVMAVRG